MSVENVFVNPFDGLVVSVLLPYIRHMEKRMLLTNR